jgi:hypothetical protein
MFNVRTYLTFITLFTLFFIRLNFDGTSFLLKDFLEDNYSIYHKKSVCRFFNTRFFILFADLISLIFVYELFKIAVIYVSNVTK